MHLYDPPKRRGVSISSATEVCDVSRRTFKASWRFQVQLKSATPRVLSHSSQRSESLFPALLSACEVQWTTVSLRKRKHASWLLVTRISLLPLTRKSRSPQRLRLPFGSMFLRFLCEESSISIDLTKCLPSQLDEALCRFYLGVRNKNGEFYKKKVYLSPIKHALKAFFIGDKIRLKGAFNGQ